jgi:hypothetical protein
MPIPITHTHTSPTEHHRRQEESIDRPDPKDLAKYGAKLKPTYTKLEEDVVRG